MADHPRDDEGKFTYKGGSSNFSSSKRETHEEKMQRRADTLYPTMNDENSIKNQIDYSNVGLGNYNSRTREDILYPSMFDKKITKENNNLEKTDGVKIASMDADKKLILNKNNEENIEKSNFPQKNIESVIGNNYNQFMHGFAKNIVGKDAAGLLDLSHGLDMHERKYLKDVIHLENYKDPKINVDKEYLESKISEQFKDYNFDKNKIKGYFFKNNSEPCKRLIQDNDFRKMIKNHKNDILQKGEFSSEFPKKGKIGLINNNFHNAIGKADFKHAYKDTKGNLHLKMYDTYDFNAKGNILIKAGRAQMKKGNLKPFLPFMI